MDFNRLMLEIYASGKQQPITAFLRTCLDQRIKKNAGRSIKRPTSSQTRATREYDVQGQAHLHKLDFYSQMTTLCTQIHD